MQQSTLPQSIQYSADYAHSAPSVGNTTDRAATTRPLSQFLPRGHRPITLPLLVLSALLAAMLSLHPNGLPNGLSVLTDIGVLRTASGLSSLRSALNCGPGKKAYYADELKVQKKAGDRKLFYIGLGYCQFKEGDDESGLFNFKQSSSLGYAPASSYLGHYYLNDAFGKGTGKSREANQLEAALWFERALSRVYSSSHLNGDFNYQNHQYSVAKQEIYEGTFHNALSNLAVAYTNLYVLQDYKSYRNCIDGGITDYQCISEASKQNIVELDKLNSQLDKNICIKGGESKVREMQKIARERKVSSSEVADYGQAYKKITTEGCNVYKQFVVDVKDINKSFQVLLSECNQGSSGACDKVEGLRSETVGYFSDFFKRADDIQ